MSQTIYQVDSFTKKPFVGNPAGVCIMDRPGDETWMQNVAREMNLPETAVLYRQENGFNLRWFTPAVEVDLCGHATLASAHILWEVGVLNSSEQARFHTRSGLLTADKGNWIEMDFPSSPVKPAEAPAEVMKALDVEPKFTGQSVFDYFIQVASERIVRGLNPDFGLLATIPTRGFIVTSESDSRDYDFVSRFFAPSAGVTLLWKLRKLGLTSTASGLVCFQLLPLWILSRVVGMTGRSTTAC